MKTGLNVATATKTEKEVTKKDTSKPVAKVKAIEKPTAEALKKATSFISKYKGKVEVKKVTKKVKKGAFSLKNFLPSAVALLEKVKRTALSWENAATGNIVGYQRAHMLGLDLDPKNQIGVLNPDSNKLVGFKRAVQLGIIKKDMLLHAA